MFDKFGPLTYEELNKTAEGLKMEGDIESLILLAEENGLEKEDAEDYADEIAIAAGIPTVYMGDVSKERAKEIIKAYYGGEKA